MALMTKPIAAAALLALAACQPPLGGSDPVDGSPEPGDGDASGVDAGHDTGPRPDAWVPGDATVPDDGICTDVIDLVFVLDVSSSMAFVLDSLEAQINEVVVAANALAEDSHFGLIPYVDNHAFDVTGDLEGGMVHTAAPSLQTAFATVRRTYTVPNRNPGDGPTGPDTQNPICEENALDALYAAATEFPWRANATRVIILATDDTFIERPDNYGDRDGDGLTDRTDYPREGDYPALRTLDETVAALQEARVRVFTFTRHRVPGPLDLTKCGTGRRLPWTSIMDGWSAPYGGRTPIPTATDAADYDIDQVRSGAISLVETINQVVVDSYCQEPVY